MPRHPTEVLQTFHVANTLHQTYFQYNIILKVCHIIISRKAFMLFLYFNYYRLLTKMYRPPYVKYLVLKHYVDDNDGDNHN